MPTNKETPETPEATNNEPNSKHGLAPIIVPALASVAIALVTTLGTIYSTKNTLNDTQNQVMEVTKSTEGLETRFTLPIGTVISSLLDSSSFAKAVGDPNVFDPEKSKWARADGQLNVKLSTYGQTFNKQTTPDFRAMFLRGLNSFDGIGSGRSDEFKDPDPNRAAGDVQKQEFMSHNHGGMYKTHPPKGGGGPDNQNLMALGGSERKFELIPNGGLETRPNNIAVYYYIKIN